MKDEDVLDAKYLGVLPEPTEKNWKGDLELVVQDLMTIDEFVLRWSGRKPSEKTDLKVAPKNSAESRDPKVEAILLEARRRMGL